MDFNVVEAGGIESLYPKISKTLANTKFYLGHNLRFVPIICTKFVDISMLA